MATSDSVHKIALDHRHEKFAQLIVRGITARDAYKAVFDNSMSNQVASAAASRLLKRVNVQQRITDLRAPAAEKATWSVAERLEYARESCELPAGRLTPEHRLCQSIKVGKDGEMEIKMPDKARMFDLYNTLAGDYGRAGSSDNPFAFVLALVQMPAQPVEQAADVTEI